MKGLSLILILFPILSAFVCADGIFIDYITFRDMPELEKSGIYLIRIEEINPEKNTFKGEIRAVIHPDDQSFKYGSVKNFPAAVPVPEPGKWIVWPVYWNSLQPEEISVNDSVIAVKDSSSGICFFLSDTPGNRRKLSLFTEQDGREHYGTAMNKEQLLLDLADQDLFTWAYEELKARQLLTENMIIEAFFRNSALTQTKGMGCLKCDLFTWHMEKLDNPTEKKRFVSKGLDYLKNHYSSETAVYFFNILASNPADFAGLMTKLFDISAAEYVDPYFLFNIYSYLTNYAEKGLISEEELFETTLTLALLPPDEKYDYDRKEQTARYLEGIPASERKRFLENWEKEILLPDPLFAEFRNLYNP